MFFSVIIPIYNNIKYIHRGIRSLMSQTFTDFEVIMVDDGSNDGSGNIIDSIAEQYSGKIKVFHKKNEGAGSARNKGIAEAKGDYLAFFDIDDEVYENWLEKCHEYLVKYSPQILMFGYEDIWLQYGTNEFRKFELALYENNEDFQKNFVERISGIRFHNGFVWNKVYERQFILGSGIKFPNLRIQQDEAFNIMLYTKVEKVLTVPDIFYKYYIYSSGNTRSRFINDRIAIYRDIRDRFIKLNQEWIGNDLRLEKYIYKRFYLSFIQEINFNLFHIDNPIPKKEKRKYLKELLLQKDIQNSIKRFNQLGLKPSGIVGSLYFFTLFYNLPSLFILFRKLHSIIR